ncbi:MAG: hypothetical protein CMC96_03615 [Flavobacteriales bacterium]|nr:hypothetical protein [Flavobacteriales bacterium]|tara:strand:- start:16448 stop:16975 length:528 start_codon:yes stop_codon:yes gene_type:complete
MSYKKKNYLLLLGSLFLFWISWELAIAETVSLVEKSKNLESQLSKVSNAPEEIAMLENRLKMIHGESQKYQLGKNEMRNRLLSKVVDLSNEHKLSLKHFPDQFVQNEQEVQLATSKIMIEGEFKNMLKLIYAYENSEEMPGKVSSAVFQVQKERWKNKRSLQLILFVQSINSLEP